MDPLYALIAGSGWASGLSLYLVVTLLGVGGRLGLLDVPETLTNPWVIAAAGALYAVEFVVDKVPYLDDAWDAVHTVVRPLGAAWLGWALAGHGGLDALGIPAAASAALALTSHAAKASARAAVNLSPEPLSNVAASLVEDGVVVGMLWLAATNPLVALALVATLAVAGAVLTALLWRALLRWRARRRALRAGRAGDGMARSGRERHPTPR